MRHTILAGTTALVLLMGSGVNIAQAQESWPTITKVNKTCIWNHGKSHWYSYWYYYDEAEADSIRSEMLETIRFWYKNHIGYSQAGLKDLINQRRAVGDMYDELTQTLVNYKDHCQLKEEDLPPNYTDIPEFHDLSEIHQVFLQKSLQEELNYTRNKKEMDDTIYSATPAGETIETLDGAYQIYQKVSKEGTITTEVFYDGATLLLDRLKIGKLKKILDKGGKVVQSTKKQAEKAIEKFNKNPLANSGVLSYASELFCSFAPNTPVLMADGSYRAISSLKAGEMVASRNEFSGTYSPRKIDYAYSSMHQDKVTLELVNSEGRHETLVTTTEHPFFVKALGFTPAGNLKAGMVLSHHTPEKGNSLHAAAVSVDSPDELHIQKVTVQKKGANHRAWNLQIAKDHTFFVGKLKSWVHNKCAEFRDLVTASDKYGLPNGIKTIAVGRTNIQGLSDKLLIGLSATVKPAITTWPANSPFRKKRPKNAFPLTKVVTPDKFYKAPKGGDHAESWILAAVSHHIEKHKLKPSDLTGKTLTIFVAHEAGVCGGCLAKLEPFLRYQAKPISPGSKTKHTTVKGIFRRFVDKYPRLTIKISASMPDLRTNIRTQAYPRYKNTKSGAVTYKRLKSGISFIIANKKAILFNAEDEKKSKERNKKRKKR